MGLRAITCCSRLKLSARRAYQHRQDTLGELLRLSNGRTGQNAAGDYFDVGKTAIIRDEACTLLSLGCPMRRTTPRTQMLAGCMPVMRLQLTPLQLWTSWGLRNACDVRSDITLRLFFLQLDLDSCTVQYIHATQLAGSQQQIGGLLDGLSVSEMQGTIQDMQQLSLERPPAPHVHSNLYVSNLPPNTDEALLRAWFQPFGNIDSIRLVRSTKPPFGKAFAFVKFASVAEALDAIQTLNQRQVAGGTLLEVKLADADAGMPAVRPKQMSYELGAGWPVL